MTKEKIQELYDRVCHLVFVARIKDALNVIEKLLVEAKNADLFDKYNIYKTTYQNIVKYTFRGAEDPNRDKILSLVVKDILELNDTVRAELLYSFYGYEIIDDKKKYNTIDLLLGSSPDKIIDNISFDREISDVIDNTLNDVGIGSSKKSDITIDDLFSLGLYKDKLSESDTDLFIKISDSDVFEWHEKSSLVSAITIGLLNGFDEQKFKVLSSFYITKENQVWQRALVGLLLGFYVYDKRVKYYPLINEMRYQLGEDDSNNIDMENIYLQLNRAKDTETVSKKMQEDIIPEMIKLKPKLEDKLEIDDLILDTDEDDRNPKWEEFFKDTPGLKDKLEEFSKMQLDGADVFMGAFAMLKQFDFFKSIKNWLVPFYSTNPLMKEALNNDNSDERIEKFLDNFADSVFMCNSDKYSFVLNLKNMPEVQKSMMFSMFDAEIGQMRELAESESLLDSASKNKTIYVQYIQDLYRFFKLNPYKNNFVDIFKQKLDAQNTESFSVMVKDNKVVRNIAEYYFQYEHYQEAEKIYQYLNREGVADVEVFEKLGYCYEKVGDYTTAIKHYKRAELFDSNRIWNLKKIAFCYKKLDDFNNAITYYKEIANLDPEDFSIQVALGNAFLKMRRFKEAMEYYYKVEVLAPSIHKVKRPLAWCAFVTGNFSEARRYYNALLLEGENRYDLMNLGHLEFENLFNRFL